MPGIIDTMVLELGLDPTKWTSGQKQAVEALRKTEAQAIRSAKNIEEAGARAAEFFTNLRNQVIGLYAAFTAGRGIKEFITDVTHSDAALGYFARRIDASVADVATFGDAVKSLGGSQEDVNSTFQAWVTDVQRPMLGEMPQLVRFWAGLGVAVIGADEKMRPLPDIMHDLNREFSKMDPAKAAEWGKSLGIPPSVMDLLLKAPEAYDRVIAAHRKLGEVTAADVAAAQKRQAAWELFMDTAESTGQVILTTLTPALVSLVNRLTDIGKWFDEHPAMIKAAFAGITALVGLLTIAISKRLLVEALGPLLGSFRAIAAVGRWALGVQVAAGAAEASAAVGGVGTALAALGTGLAILTGIGAAIAAIGVAAYEIYEHWEGIKSFFGFGGGAKPAGLSPLEQAAKAANVARPGIVPATVPASNSDISTLMNMGWTREQAIGILSNVQGESSGNIHAENMGHYGLAQWDARRQANFARWAGHDIRSSTREEQLGFINYELREGTERLAGRRLSESSSANAATQAIYQYYERPGGGDRSLSRRLSIASALGAAPSTLALANSGVGSNMSYDQRSHNVTAENHIGQIIVNTSATDATGIVRDIKSALQRETFIANANTGPS